MTYVKLIVDLIGAVAWPGAILTIALIYRKPIYSILHSVGGIAERAVTQPLRLSVKGFEVDFKDAVAAKNPKSVDEALATLLRLMYRTVRLSPVLAASSS